MDWKLRGEVKEEGGENKDMIDYKCTKCNVNFKVKEGKIPSLDTVKGTPICVSCCDKQVAEPWM